MLVQLFPEGLVEPHFSPYKIYTHLQLKESNNRAITYWVQTIHTNQTTIQVLIYDCLLCTYWIVCYKAYCLKFALKFVFDNPKMWLLKLAHWAGLVVPLITYITIRFLYTSIINAYLYYTIIHSLIPNPRKWLNYPLQCVRWLLLNRGYAVASV